MSNRRQRNQGCADHHARPQPRSQCADALVCIELEDVPEQQHEHEQQQQEHEKGKRGKGKRLTRCFRIQERNIRGVERLQSAQQAQKQQHSHCEECYRATPRLAQKRHAAIIVRLSDTCAVSAGCRAGVFSRENASERQTYICEQSSGLSRTLVMLETI